MSKKKPIEKKLPPLPAILPLKGEWQLMDKNSLPTFYTQIMTLSAGKGKDKKEVGRVGIAINGAALYLFTTEPHPEDPNRSATYALPLAEPLTEAMSSLVNRGED